MTSPEVFSVRDRPLLLDAVAARLVTRIVDLQALGGRVRLLVGGDPLVTELLRHLSDSPARDAVEWSRLEVWWADDAWVPADSPLRARTQADVLFSRVDYLPAHLHPMPADDGVTSPESAAAAHGSALLSQRWPDDHGLTPTFDLAILGLGPEGSVAGLRPEQPSVHDPRTVTADRPAGRLTLTLTGLSTAREVWLLGSGGGSAAATVLTLSGAGALQVPAAGVRGVQRTLLLLDEAAASRLPPALHRLASP